MFVVPGALSRENKALLKQCYCSLDKKYNVKQLVGEDIDKLIESFHLFKILQGAEALTIIDALQMHRNQQQCTLCILAVDDFVEHVNRYGVVHRKAIKEVTAITTTPLPHDFGHILIRPETIGDKIAEIFEKHELDFEEHPQFSDRYYVSARNESKARKHMDFRMLDALNAEKDFVVEIHGSMLVAKKLLNSFNMDSVSSLVSLAMAL